MPESQFVIYGLCLDTPNIDHVRYVGMTRRGRRGRVRSHVAAAFRDGIYLVHRWIRKYGAQRITSIVLEEVESAASLPDRERYWIRHLRTHVSFREGGLNCTWGGEFGSVWDSLNSEQKNAIRERMRRVQRLHSTDSELAAARSERSRRIMTEVNARPEVVEEKSKRMRAMHCDPEFAAASSERASKRMKSLHQDPEFASRRDQRSRDRWMDPEYREMMTQNAKKTGQMSSHIRWHVKREIVKPGCPYCS